MKINKIFSRYPIYLFVGGGVTLITVFLRNIVGLIINDKTNSQYIASMIIAYCFGIILSLIAHKSITFKSSNKMSFNEIFKFTLTHFLGMICSLFLAVKLRIIILDNLMSQSLSKTIAFAIAALIVSIMTYIVKKYFVFTDK